jgi:hypothetical protein
MKQKPLFTLFVLLLGSSWLMGCQQEQSARTPPVVSLKSYEKATTLQGTLSGGKGFVATGTLKASDGNGQVIATTVLHNNKKYSLDIPAHTPLPLVLTFSPDSSQSKTEALVTVVVHPSITKYDINPLTTQIAKKAQALGGYTAVNLVQAAESTVSVPDADKTSAGFRGDPTTHYGGWH